ncbi:MAG: SIMPL domain-containing protein [Planctomycetaceae bacterium]
MISVGRKHRFAFIVMIALAFVISLHADGAMAEDGISVNGTGKASALPDLVEMGGTVTGDAELAQDAMTKFRNNRRRTVSAIESLKIDGLVITGGGMSISSGDISAQVQQMMMGRGMTQTPSKVNISEPLTFQMTGIDQAKAEELFETIIKVADAGKDSGIDVRAKPMSAMQMQLQMQMGQSATSALALYKTSRVDELKHQAYEKAMQDATANAERLAKLAGVKLGKVLSIQEIPVAKKSNPEAAYYARYGIQLPAESDDYSSNTFSEIAVEIQLNVRFSIE